jgi:cysteine desulfurase family protein
MNVYLDNAATGWPKPPETVAAMRRCVEEFGASPGRSAHALSLRAAREVFETRELVASLFHCGTSGRVIFSANATHALNMAFHGALSQGDHVIVSHLEHNSVIRPLRHLEAAGIISLSLLDFDEENGVDLKKLENSLRENTRLVAVTHGSNVNGMILPVKEIGTICRRHKILFLVDAAQTAGYLPIDMEAFKIDMLAFTGHKKLYGPQGIGGLCLEENVELRPMFQGGTGSRSELETHPGFYPDRLEAGTPNTPGIAGLKAGIEHIINNDIENIGSRVSEITRYFIRQLKSMNELSVYASESTETILPVVGITSSKFNAGELAFHLDRKCGIMVRAGLQCAPLAHKALGTFPEGTVRFSFGIFNTKEEIDYTVESLKSLHQKI